MDEWIEEKEAVSNNAPYWWGGFRSSRFGAGIKFHSTMIEVA